MKIRATDNKKRLGGKQRASSEFRFLSSQSGMVAIMVTIIMMLVISLIVVGFAEVSRRNGTESLDRQLSTQAFYAAETGVNDAVAGIKNGTIDLSSSSANSYNTDCTALTTLLGSSVLSARDNVSYSCLLLNGKPSSIETTVDLGGGQVLPVKLNAPSSLKFTWSPSLASGNVANCPATATTFKPNPAGWNNCSYGLLRVDLYQDGSTLDPATMAKNTVALYLVPHNGGAGVVAVNLNPGNTNRVYPALASCTATQCQVTVNGITSTNYYARLSSIYAPVGKVSISGGPNTTFSDAQVLIDVTGKAQNVLRRIQVRVPLGGSSNIGLPINGLQSEGGICKLITVVGTSVTDACPNGVPPSGPPPPGPGPVPPPVVGSCAGGFCHPGVVLSAAQLNIAQAKIAANANPWTAGFMAAKKSVYGSLVYKPNPVATLNCNATPSQCVDLNSDGTAAATQAMLYYYSKAGDPAKNVYAQNAIKILNAWATTVTSIPSIAGGTQASLAVAWTGESFTRAAEIMRYTYTPGPLDASLNIGALNSMFTNLFLPHYDANRPEAYSSNGNWQLAMISAKMGIGVFEDNAGVFNQAVSEWRTRVPEYIYLTSDGAQPLVPTSPVKIYNTPRLVDCFWRGLGSGAACAGATIPADIMYVDGQGQEVCRDISHVQLGLSSLVNGAETAYIQGVDLFNDASTQSQKRITEGYNFLAGYDLNYLKTGNFLHDPCGGDPTNKTGGTGYKLGWEILYNHYTVENPTGGIDLSNVKTLLNYPGFRPTPAANQVAWETMSSAAP